MGHLGHPKWDRMLSHGTLGTSHMAGFACIITLRMHIPIYGHYLGLLMPDSLNAVIHPPGYYILYFNGNKSSLSYNMLSVCFAYFILYVLLWLQGVIKSQKIR